MPTVAQVVSVLEAAYDPRRAESWDAVGLVCGDPAAPVRRVMFAVDPAAPVIEQALAWGAQLLVTHHPLLLKPVHGVAATSFKGRAVHRLITGGTALFTAHTNADLANPGVSDALARALGLEVTGPIQLSPHPADSDSGGSPDAAGEAAPAAQPGLGRFGVLPASERLADFARRVAAALPPTGAGVRVAGPPDRPVRLVAVCGGAGDDRELLAAVRAAGADAYVTADLRHHPASEALEAGGFGSPDGGPALVDVAHWASEWPWLAEAAALLARHFGGQVDFSAGGTVESGFAEAAGPADAGQALPAGAAATAPATPVGAGGPGDNLEIRVSTLVTDPWSLHLPQKHSDVL